MLAHTNTYDRIYILYELNGTLKYWNADLSSVSFQRKAINALLRGIEIKLLSWYRQETMRVYIFCSQLLTLNILKFNIACLSCVCVKCVMMSL